MYKRQLLECAWKGDKSLGIAQLLLARTDIKVNLQENNGFTPLDEIIDQIKQQKENYTYVKLWDALIAKGAILKKRTKAYKNLNPSNFKEPQKGYVQAIKNNPSINRKLSSLTQENDLLRKQLEDLKKTNTITKEQVKQLTNDNNDLTNKFENLKNQHNKLENDKNLSLIHI